MISRLVKRDLQHTGVGYIDFLKFMSIKLNPSSYFEIGTQTGLSVRQFQCPSVCVDPHFRLSHDVIKNKKSTFFFQMTSDEFFADHVLSNFIPNGPDICFLDGMHRYEYLLRDFYNVEAFCTDRSVIIMHDCLPDTWDMTSRYSPTEINWTGDVWKMIPIIKKYRPDIRMFFVDCPPTGLVVCTRLDSTNRILKDRYYDIIDEFNDETVTQDDIHKIRSLCPMIDSKLLVEQSQDVSLLF